MLGARQDVPAAREQIQDNKLNEAQNSQQKSVAGLEKLVKNLEDRREAELARLALEGHEIEGLTLQISPSPSKGETNQIPPL